MNNNINIKVRPSEYGDGGLVRYSVKMLTSDHVQDATNEVPLLLNAMKHSRFPDVDLHYTLDFREDETFYDPDDFRGTLSLLCKYGVDDITDTLVDGDIEWRRISLDQEGNERTASDNLWNALHDVSRWPVNRKVLNLVHSDISADTGFPSRVTFRANVTVRDGRGDANILHVEMQMT